LEFLYPKSLQRLSGFYPNLSTNFIKHYLQDFEKKASDLNTHYLNQFYKNQQLNDIIYEHFLVPDSNSLNFSEVKRVKETDYEKLKDYYYKIYLGNYQESMSYKKDEQHIIHQIKNYIGEKNPQIKNKLDKDIKISNQNWGVELNIELAWKNGTYNLVTPIGFDLHDQKSIIEKATRWFGTLNFLNEADEINNYKFDILSSRPTRRELYKPYEKALQIIGDVSTPKRIYEEDSYESYVDELISTIG
jgi:hypothetical protein